MENNTKVFQFRTLAEKTIYRDVWIGLREDTVLTPENSTIQRKVIEYRNSSAIVALTDDLKILLIKHFRYPVGASVWDIPGGIATDSETAVECALRELREETGFQPGRIEPLLDYFPEPAFSNQVINLFIATGIHRVPGTIQEEVEIERVQLFDLHKTPEMILNGEIKSSWTIIGILMALRTYRI